MIHPIYPFLCPETTRRQMSMPGLLPSLAGDKAFAALYYAVVAVGCQHSEGGTFEAGTGEAWSYFERSLSYFQNIVFLRGSLTAIQVCSSMPSGCELGTN